MQLGRGREWMWEGVEPGKDSPRDMLWVADGLTNGSLTWVTDGSYNRKKAIDLCGVGWIIFAPKQGTALLATFGKNPTQQACIEQNF